MPISRNPQYNPTSAYQPIQWEVFSTSPTPSIPVETAQFEVVVNGTVIAIDRKDFYRTAPSLFVPGAVEYYFLIDVQTYLQRFLAPSRNRSSMINNDLLDDYRVMNADAYVEVLINVAYYIKDSNTGKLSPSGATDTGAIRYVCISKRQNGQDRSLDEFVNVPGVPPLARFLTNKPLVRDIDRLQGDFISFISNWNTISVLVQDNNGSFAGPFYLPTNAAINAQTTIGIGPPNLSAATGWIPSPPPLGANIARYFVVAGTGIVSPGPVVTFTPGSEQLTFNLVSKCSKSLRVYFLNDLGGFDSLVIPFIDLQDTVSSQTFEKALSWDGTSAIPHQQGDFGTTVNNIKVQRRFLCRMLAPSSDIKWLRELRWSAEVYIENPEAMDGNIWRVYPLPETFIERKNKGTIEFEFELGISQNIVTHRI